MMINPSNTLQQSHEIMKKLGSILKEYQQFKLLQMNVIRKELIFLIFNLHIIKILFEKN